MNETLNLCFPALASEGYEETSPATSNYNCIAWAAGKQDLWWWPVDVPPYYWPEGHKREETLHAFFLAFESLGYVRCDTGELEPGFEKVAIYALKDKPKHAARQMADGRWTSKLGKNIDILHTLRGLEGAVYGQVAGFLKRVIAIA